MSEKITIAELIEGSGNNDSRTLLAGVVLNAMGCKPHEDFGIIPGETKEITIDFKINGVTVSFKDYIDFLEKSLDRVIQIEAGKLLRSKLKDDAYKSLDNMSKMIRKAEIELFETYFPNDPEFLETRYDQ